MGSTKGSKAQSAAVAAVAKQTEKLKIAAESAKDVKHTISSGKIKEEKKHSKEVDAKEEKAHKPLKTKEDDDAKEKRPPTDYQLFLKAKLAELREEYDDEETRPGYRDLIKMVSEAWQSQKPKKEPRQKKEKAERKKREPTAYNLFVKDELMRLKKEHEDDDADEKPNQKELMKLAAAKWQEHKAAIAKKE
jgi:hypothetical protein